MARLESIARAGYYPTPPRVVTAIARHLRPLDTDGKCTIRLLDPCAGTGAAAASLGQHLSAETFGIELNDERAATARNQPNHVLHTSAFSVRLANGAFSCLFLNPPYDYDDEGRRLEHAFLTSLTRALAPGGVLVFLVPQPRLAVSARYLSSHFTEIRAVRFPQPEYRAFRQIVLFGLRKGKAVPDPASQATVEAWSHGELEPLPNAVPAPIIAIPRLPAGDVLFASLTFDPRQAAREAQRHGVWAQPELIEQLWPSDEQPVRPLMPLRRGHLALLVAAGLLNNCTLSQGEDRVLVKGRTYKEMVQVDSDDEDVEVRREVIRTSIAVLNLGTGALEIVEQAGEARAKSAERTA
ncbi:MAG: class I SAM-dependent methyltransferase [Chloroflexi bacterium]|nr:class I SAM-dependent methyltransferase [Chloroflexota bacterium]